MWRQFMWQQLKWRRLPRPSREALSLPKDERPRPRTYGSVSAFALLLCSTPLALATAWTVHSEPARLLNGAPVLFQVHAPAELDSLTGTWFGHQLTFSYNASTKTWFAIAGVSIETNPGKYTLELSGDSAATKALLKFTRSFVVARAQYPKIKVQLAVEKKFTEPSPSSKRRSPRE